MPPGWRAAIRRRWTEPVLPVPNLLSVAPSVGVFLLSSVSWQVLSGVWRMNSLFSASDFLCEWVFGELRGLSILS